MKRVTRKVKQALSILLVAAMIITMAPQNTLRVSAEEGQAVESVSETETVLSAVDEKTEETNTSTETDDETMESDEEADTEEAGEEKAGEETEDADVKEAGEEATDQEPEETDAEEIADEKTEEDEKLEDEEEITGEEMAEEETEEGIRKCTDDLGSSAKKYTLTFNLDSTKQAEIRSVKQGTDIDIESLEGTTVSDVVEGMDLTFQAGVKSGSVYKVKSVTANGGKYSNEVLTATDAANGTYTVQLTNNVTITVAVEPDETKCSVLDIDVNEKALAEAFTVKVAGDAHDYNAATGNNQYLTADTDAKTVTVTPTDKENYTIKDIELNGDRLTTDGSSPKAAIAEDTGAWTFTVDWPKDDSKKVQSVKVYVEPVTSKAASTVVFYNRTTHMELKVTEAEDKVTNIELNKFTVAAGADFLRFTITVGGRYEPVVAGKSFGIKTINAVTVEKKDGRTVYTYDIEARKLAEYETITITEVNAKYDVAVIYDTDAIDSVEFIQNGSVQPVKPVSATPESGKSTATLTDVEDGQKVNVTVNAKEGYKLVSASEEIGGGTPEVTDLKGTADAYTYELTVSDDTTTTITSKAIARAALNDGTGVATANGKGEYDVAFGDGRTYTAQLMVGGVAQTLTEVTVADAGNKQTKAVLSDDKTKAEITLVKESAGEKVEITLKSGEGNTALTETIVLNVAKPASKATIKVEGVKNKKLTQFVDTVKIYSITIPAGYADTLDVDVPPEAAGISAVINEEGKLEVTVDDTATPDKPVKIKIYDIYDTNDAADKKALNGGEITITPAYLLNGVKPAVSLKDATDTELTLTLTSRVSDETLANGQIWYKYTITPVTEIDGTVLKTVTGYVERTGNSQDVENLKVIDAAEGEGCKADFTVDVSLYQTKSGKLSSANENEAVTKADAKHITASTKEPYYTTKLGVKKLNGGKAYTGQSVEVAQITFDKPATYKSLSAIPDDDSVFTVEPIGTDGKIKIKVNTGLAKSKLGKHSIYVTSLDDGRDDKLYVAKTTVTVDIVRGIEGITLTVPKTVYKESGKAASFTTAIDYYGGNYAIRTKKVKWEIKAADGKSDPNPDIKKHVTIKNGKVTINKNFSVSPNKADNKFAVVATAADFEGNTTSRYEVCEITSEKAVLGDVVVYDSFYNKIYDVNDRIDVGLKQIYVTVLKPDAVRSPFYYDINDVESDVDVSFKSSNKAVTIDSYGRLEATKPVKNVKITVTATDGSKASKTITLKEVGYIGDIGLDITSEYGTWAQEDYPQEQSENQDLSFYGPKDAAFTLETMLKYSKWWQKPSSRGGGHDCTIKVKNARIVSKDANNESYRIIATGSPVTITLQSKTLNKTVVYKLTNKSYANATAKAPKLKTTGKLAGGNYYVGENGCQTLTCSLPDTYDGTGKCLYITRDSADAAKRRGYGSVCNSLGMSGGLYVSIQNGKATLTFHATEDVNEDSAPDTTSIPVGSYKLNYAVGTIDDNYRFIAETKPAALSVKAVKAPDCKTGMTASYSLSVKEGATAKLQLSNKEAEIYSAQLFNANIKGEENYFTKYFTVDNEGNLSLKALSPEDLAHITGKDGKNDLTGWVKYQYTVGDDPNPYDGADRMIRISFKDLVQKYSLSRPTVLTTAKSVDLTAYAGKEKADIAYVLVTDGGFTTDNVNQNADKATITLRKDSWEKSNKVTLRILPKGSCYAAEVEKVKTEDAQFAEAMNTYGIEVTATIAAKTPESATGKIKINSKDAAQTFTATELDDDYVVEAGKGYYVVRVPYTTTVENVADFTVEVVRDADKGMLKVETDKVNRHLVVKLDKAALAEKAKNTATTGVAYGRRRMVEFALTFADNAPAEKIKLNLTLPKEVTADYTSVQKAVEEALGDVTAGVYDVRNRNLAFTAEYNRAYIEGLISDLVPADSDIKPDINVGNLTLPSSSGRTGSVRVVVTLTDLTQNTAAWTKTMNLTLMADMAPVGLRNALEGYVKSLKGTISDQTIYEEVLQGARDAVNITQYPNLRLCLEDPYQSDRWYRFTLAVYDINNGDVDGYGVARIRVEYDKTNKDYIGIYDPY